MQAKYDPQCHPLTVLNDGSETALNIRVLDAETPGGTATFGTHGTHVAAGESVALNIFHGSKRLDRTLWESLTHLLGVSEKGDGNPAGLWRLPVRMLYDDHQGRSPRDRFDIVLEVIPRDDGNFQLCDLRVEKAAKF